MDARWESHFIAGADLGLPELPQWHSQGTFGQHGSPDASAIRTDRPGETETGASIESPSHLLLDAYQIVQPAAVQADLSGPPRRRRPLRLGVLVTDPNSPATLGQA